MKSDGHFDSGNGFVLNLIDQLSVKLITRLLVKLRVRLMVRLVHIVMDPGDSLTWRKGAGEGTPAGDT